MDTVTAMTNQLSTLRTELRVLRAWAESQLDADTDWQNVAEHMTAVLDALICGEVPPRPL
ncbi:hypothetical protein Adi01nite_74400 [Amorphoplanes digitatis]|nr:hypothetical protein GCM10020092_088690 [Actinoplanes digitatis]GID98028.1 hypothetical protein Adi01nite_74400 [Actinoplanes digitatis]